MPYASKTAGTLTPYYNTRAREGVTSSCFDYHSSCTTKKNREKLCISFRLHYLCTR